MSKLVYGKKGQVRFENEAEKQEAFEYLLTSPNVKFVHENNQDQGAWGPEKRILFKSEEGIPDSLKRNMTAGVSGIFGRINSRELWEELKNLKEEQ
ncbi:hypothetical protein [Weissella confusa]|jgi:hypothetical protein|uniref:hypothetical protein n=1 Tax=Weissella confusa TaxID=1583 RepID=UPI00107EFF16|nr:hypothetical protein [Weissella confusa]MED4273154.1 hypothetical protein [Weissella confusa]QBZ03266.1 hypothetical protein C6P13_08340 [Weissella confusa]QYU58312.1 hypothetical protein K1728_02600 [Weissella confusa]TGE59389.1 hypothetical protein C6P16_08365 [Weissella confusa]TGE67262.1 hypothetical protein C6P15_08875 [Weissella confusa]